MIQSNLSLSLLILSFTSLCAVESLAAEGDVLFFENFEDGNAKGWEFDGRGTKRVTVYSGNHSLNISRNRTAQVAVNVEGYDSLRITMQLAAMNLEQGETCRAEVSANEGERWQGLLTVDRRKADGVTLHSNTGNINRSLGATPLLLRFRADGGRHINCWGDNVEVIGHKR